MRDRTRRTELGRVLLDVAKYVVTIVVIGGLISERVNVGAVLLGVVLAIGIGAIGFQVIPPEEDGS